MPAPTPETWRHREVVTSIAANRRIRDVHRYLYEPPSVRLTGRQVGQDPTAPEPDALGTTWLPSGGWHSTAWYLPGTGVQPTQEWDTTDGQMLITQLGAVLRIEAPESGLYAVSTGVVVSPSTAPTAVNLRLGLNIVHESEWSSGQIFAADSPGKSSATRYVGSITQTVALRTGDWIGVAGSCDRTYFLGSATAPGRTFISVQWVGGYP